MWMMVLVNAIISLIIKCGFPNMLTRQVTIPGIVHSWGMFITELLVPIELTQRSPVSLLLVELL